MPLDLHVLLQAVTLVAGIALVASVVFLALGHANRRR